jgi:hypothetical protein
MIMRAVLLGVDRMKIEEPAYMQLVVGHSGGK